MADTKWGAVVKVNWDGARNVTTLSFWTSSLEEFIESLRRQGFRDDQVISIIKVEEQEGVEA
jgi:hypothetical protein